MLQVLIISAVALLGLIALIFFKPSVIIRGRSFNIYWLAPLLGAALLVLLGSIGLDEVAVGLTDSSGMNPIKILVLLISMTVISIYLDNAGFFSYIAARMLRVAGSSSTALFFLLYAIVSFLTFFTSNDIIVLTFTPFICYFARSAKIDPVPFLVCEFVAANTWSMALIIGNPTNIYLASNAGIEFFEYLKTMIIPTLASALVSLAIMWLVFRRKLSVPITPQEGRAKLKNRFHVYAALVHLIVCIILMSVSLYIDIPMWLISLCACLSLLSCSLLYSLIRSIKPMMIKNTLKRAPWDVVPFVISMFIIVLAFEKSGITEKLSAFLMRGNAVFTFGGASFLSANLINNIPMSVLFSSVCGGVAAQARPPALYASIAGSNIGAFLTPIGAIAGIMWMSLLKIQRVEFGYTDFIKYGAIISVPTMIAALAALSIII